MEKNGKLGENDLEHYFIGNNRMRKKMSDIKKLKDTTVEKLLKDIESNSSPDTIDFKNTEKIAYRLGIIYCQVTRALFLLKENSN